MAIVCGLLCWISFGQVVCPLCATVKYQTNTFLCCILHCYIPLFLFHTMAYFYVLYRYVISEWRSIRPVKINQYDITMTTHYDITMGNDTGMCIVMSQWLLMLLEIAIVMSQ